MNSPRDDEYRRRLRGRVRRDELWRPPEPEQLELLSDPGGLRHIGGPLIGFSQRGERRRERGCVPLQRSGRLTLRR